MYAERQQKMEWPLLNTNIRSRQRSGILFCLNDDDLINTYSVEQSTREDNRFSASQEITHILWNPRVHYHVYNSPPPFPILNHINPVHAPLSHFLKVHLNIIPLTMPGSSKWSLSVRFSHQNAVYISPRLHTCFMPRPSHSWFDHPNNIWWRIRDH